MKIFLWIFLVFYFNANAQNNASIITHDLSLKDCVPPSYPPNSRLRNEQGVVDLVFRVTGNGIVSEAIIKKSSGFHELDNAAMTAIKFCKFKTAGIISESESILSSGKFTFRLEDLENKETNIPDQYKPAKTITCGTIEYPALARALHREGKTTLSFIVGIDGSTRNPEVKNSSGSDLLDSASKENLAKCRYTPATVNGSPIESVMQQSFSWRLTDNKIKKKAESSFSNLHSLVKLCNDAEYPTASWRFEEEGTTRVRVYVSKDGIVEKTNVIKSSGFGRLDATTAKVFREQCQFEKLIIDNKSIPYSIIFDYKWIMDDRNSIKFIELEL